MKQTIIPHWLPESVAATYVGKPRELVVTQINGYKVLQVHDGVTPGGTVIGGATDTIRKTSGSNQPLHDLSAYQTLLYDGPVTTNNNGVHMGYRFRTLLNSQLRDIGFIGFQQRNSSNASVRFEVWARTETGEPTLIMYSDQVAGALTVPVAMSVQALAVANGLTVSQPSSFANNAPVDFGARITMAQYQRINFENNNLTLRQKTGDNTTLLIEATGARNVEIITNGATRVHVKANGQLAFPNLPTYADDSAATSGGLVAGEVYKTSTGELRIKV